MKHPQKVYWIQSFQKYYYILIKIDMLNKKKVKKSMKNKSKKKFRLKILMKKKKKLCVFYDSIEASIL